jgi:SAM-dependent methyltransferase
MRKAFVKVEDRPDLYDWLHDHTRDVPMYLELAKSHDILLECGIGTGRIAIPLAASGKTVYGIDNSRAMLAHLSKKLSEQPSVIRDRVYPIEADMRDFALGHQFSFIYIPYSTFNYLLSLKDQKNSLEAIRRHLAEGGIAVFEVLSFSYHPDWLDNIKSEETVKIAPYPGTNEFVNMRRIVEFDSVTQLVRERRYYAFYDEDWNFKREEIVTGENRFFLIGEMELLLESTGFKIEKEYGDWSFGEYQHTSEFVVVVAKLAR